MAKKKDQDEIIVDVNEVYTKTEVFIDRNRKILSIVLIAIIVIVAAGAGYYYLLAKPKEQRAAQESWKAEQYFELDSLDLAIYGDGLYLGLDDIVREHSGTKAAARGNYALGIISRDRGDFEEAMAHFKKVDVSDEVVRVLAIAGIGDCQVELSQYADAAKSFERAVSLAKGTKAEAFIAPIMHYKAGVAYLELEERAKALKQFDQIVKNYPDAQNYSIAERYVAYLGQK